MKISYVQPARVFFGVLDSAWALRSYANKRAFKSYRPFMRTTISVVIPAYNEAELLEKCLNALSQQSRHPDHIIVVNNNSNDDTVKIARAFKNVTVVHEKTQGIAAATKKGLDEASQLSDIILRCDADCRPAKNWVEAMERHFASNPSTKAVTGPGVPYDVSAFQRLLISSLYMKPYFIFVASALGTRPLFGSNFGIRSNEWKKIATSTHLNRRQDIHDDMDISFHLRSKITYDPELKMPLSPRPFYDFSQMPRRYMRGIRTVVIHWPRQLPWKNFYYLWVKKQS